MILRDAISRATHSERVVLPAEIPAKRFQNLS